MKNPFKDKFLALVGTPRRCTRREVKDEILATGGIVEENITTFLHYVVAFSGAEKTVRYKKAFKFEEKGLLTIINEDKFFEMLETRTV